jgi:hypothetical protein
LSKSKRDEARAETQSTVTSVAVASYRDARNQLDAIYASGRLALPFEGVLLFGY